ncbi:precorrin-2 dehydrogenase/sirohydrochlorin ferrochelatase family protein [Aquisphaera insulae]|uniref:precorrin-2 dehydrogenase/sirohydrochlorin ferrochelatase family protein n=1 Tax=Aquisphaera insulae TaxID=2712864 RepID=UPI0013EBB6B2|nr:NAD(P)-dependent oxidoreductase [Aquisphaera insulae]
MPGYTIELKLEGRTAVVVGLGAVGRRKAAGLRAAGARVVGVDPVASRTIAEELAGVEVVAEPYRDEHLRDAFLAIAAASPEVNRLVAADAKARGILVCSASDPDAGDFVVPASWIGGPLALTVSTSGASPALAAALRDRAVQALGPAAAGLAAVLADLRPLALARISDPDARRRILREWAEPRWLELCREQGPEAVRLALLRELAEASRPTACIQDPTPIHHARIHDAAEHRVEAEPARMRSTWET